MNRRTSTVRRAPVCLVVDESAVDREAGAAMLRACGLRVLTAASTSDARALLGCIAPDALVVDADAEGTAELVAAVRADPDLSPVRLVAHGGLSADALCMDLVVARLCAPAALHAVAALASRPRAAA